MLLPHPLKAAVEMTLAGLYKQAGKRGRPTVPKSQGSSNCLCPSISDLDDPSVTIPPAPAVSAETPGTASWESRMVWQPTRQTLEVGGVRSDRSSTYH